MRVGEKIKELRQEKGLSQAQLGKRIGASQKAVDYWERGINEPKVSYIIALVRFFELSYDDFFAELDLPDKE
ncbi:MAG: helix-turn-helix transcriptional regulator [Clostridia bacterium]|nr:helix-turn-helix transcriptional regulator [Clostridia bacterium]